MGYKKIPNEKIHLPGSMVSEISYFAVLGTITVPEWGKTVESFGVLTMVDKLLFCKLLRVYLVVGCWKIQVKWEGKEIEMKSRKKSEEK